MRANIGGGLSLIAFAVLTDACAVSRSPRITHPDSCGSHVECYNKGLQALGEAKNQARKTVPIGTIIDWYRLSEGTPVPDGFQVCDGSVIIVGPFVGRKTPDLRGRVALGAEGVEMIGEAGGLERVSIEHVHDFKGATAPLGGGDGWTNLYNGNVQVNHHTHRHVHEFEGKTGVFKIEHDNRPPFVKTLKIIRIE